jgi:hypothetical protein
MKAEPVGLVDPPTDPAQAFEQTDEERMKSRVYMATQQALLGPYNPRAARACVYGAALLCVEVGIEASKAVDAFREEYERVSASFDRLGKFPERLTASVGLERGSSSDQEKPQASDKRRHRL